MRRFSSQEVLFGVLLLVSLALFVSFFSSYVPTGYVVQDAQRFTLTEGESIHVYGRTLELVTTFTGGQKYSDAGAFLRVGHDSDLFGEGDTQILDDLRVHLESVSHTYGRDNEQLGSSSVVVLVSKYEKPLLSGYDLLHLPAPFVKGGRYNLFTVAVAESGLSHAHTVAAHFQAERHLPHMVPLAELTLTDAADNIVVVGLCREVARFAPGCVDVPAGSGYVALSAIKHRSNQAKHSLDTYLVLTGQDDAGVSRAVDALVAQDPRLRGLDVVV